MSRTPILAPSRQTSDGVDGQPNLQLLGLSLKSIPVSDFKPMDAPFNNGTPQQFCLDVTLRTGRLAADSTSAAAYRKGIHGHPCRYQLVRAPTAEVLLSWFSPVWPRRLASGPDS